MLSGRRSPRRTCSSIPVSIPAWAPRSAASPISRPTHWHLCTVHLLPAMAPALCGPWPTITTVAFPVRSPKYFGAWQPKSFGRCPLLTQSGHHSSVMAAVELTARCRCAKAANSGPPNMDTTGKFEVFGAGCAGCEETIEMVVNAAGSSCEIIVQDMKDTRIAERAKSLGIRSVPAVVIDGRLVGSGRGVDEQALRTAGLGQPL